jgi:prolyl 4-hydroxylase
VFDAYKGGLKFDEMRTNSAAPFSLIHSDLVVQLVRARLAHAANVAFDALESPDVLHYAVGERISLHVDFFHPSLPDYQEEMRLRGQRVKTCLVYLNDDYEGGRNALPPTRLEGPRRRR